MKKMKRFAAWIVLMAILLSSFGFAEETVAAEIIEAADAAAVEEIFVEEIPAEEAAVEMDEETAEEISVEAAETGAAVEAVAAHECTSKAGWQSSDSLEHWMRCDICGQVQREEHKVSRVLGSNKKTHAYKCDVCGRENEDQHVFDCMALTDEFLMNPTVEAFCLVCSLSFDECDQRYGFHLEHREKVDYDNYDGYCNSCRPNEDQRYCDHQAECWENGWEKWTDMGDWHALYCGICGGMMSGGLHEYSEFDPKNCSFCTPPASSGHVCHVSWWHDDGDVHYGYCNECDEMVVEPHRLDVVWIGSSAGCYNPCTVCSGRTTKLHTFSCESLKDGQSKYAVCLNCEYDFSDISGEYTVQHVSAADENGYCSGCMPAPCAHEACDWASIGSGRHASVCRNCGVQVETGDCAPSCSNAGACYLCGAAYSGSAEPRHNTWNANKGCENWVYGNQWACGTKCLDCGKWDKSEPHAFVNKYCTRCGARNSCKHKTSYFNHKDLGDGTHAKICGECKEAIEIAEHIFSGTECTKCGALGECQHVYSIWGDLGNGKHGRVCSGCGIRVSDEEEAHYRNCDSSSNKCSVCDATENVPVKHDYTGWDGLDNWQDIHYGKHALVCRDCGEYKPGTEEAHFYDADGGCIACINRWQDHDCYDYCGSHSGICYECGEPTDGVRHSGGETVKVDEYYHGEYCDGCGVLYNVDRHYVSCTSGNEYCGGVKVGGCGEKIDPKCNPIEHVGMGLTVPDSKNPDYHYDMCMFCDKQMRELHYANCNEENVACSCGALVAKGKRHVGVDYSKKPVLNPADSSEHGWLCSCGEIVDSQPHCYVDGICVECGAETTSVEELEFYPEKLTMAVGQEIQSELLITGTAASIEYKSSSAKTASVDENGVITAKRAGSATITAVAYGVDGTKASAKLKLTVKKAPTKVALNAKKLAFPKDKFSILTATLSPKGAYSDLTWTSSDESIVTVDENGMVYGVGEGKAIITVETFNGLTASCEVESFGPAVDLVVKETEITIGVKESYTLNAKAYTAAGNEAVGEPTFFVNANDKNIFSIDENGKITGKKAGEGNVIVMAGDGLAAEVKVHVLGQPGTVNLNVAVETVNRGETLQLVPSIPENTKTAYSWSTNAKKVATVDKNGLVTAVAEGKATITVKTANGRTAYASITVVDPYKPSGVELNVSGTVMLPMNERLQLHADILPETAKSELSWSTKNKKVATVDENGLVTPKKEGTTIITVSTYNGKTDTVKVQVVDPLKAASVELNVGANTTIAVGEILMLEATVLPSTAETSLKWSSSNKKVASVDEGAVLGLKAGTATITVKTANGKSDTVKVKVVAENTKANYSAFTGDWELQRVMYEGVSVPAGEYKDKVDLVINKNGLNFTFEGETVTTSDTYIENGYLFVEDGLFCSLYGKNMLILHIYNPETNELMGMVFGK